jgi:hypothetical protein
MKIVKPTIQDYAEEQTSRQKAFLSCVVIKRQLGEGYGIGHSVPLLKKWFDKIGF